LQFDEASSFSEGVASVEVKGKHFFIDKKGKIAVQPQFDYSDIFFGGKFSEGWVRWRFDGDKWGYLNGMGKVVIPPLYDCTWDFSEGLARVQIGESWGFIDKTGTMIIEPKHYSVVADFSGGVASAITEEGENVFFDKTGKIIWLSK
jgi:hypothetical protein